MYEVLHTVNGLISSKWKFNHVLATLYNDEKDNIGYHSDKIKDIEEESFSRRLGSFLVLVVMQNSRIYSLGAG